MRATAGEMISAIILLHLTSLPSRMNVKLSGNINGEIPLSIPMSIVTWHEQSQQLIYDFEVGI